MPPAEERDSPTTDPNPGTASQESAERTPLAERTPNVDGAPSAMRSIDVTPAPGSDTLLSAPQITREDLAFDARLSEAEREIRDIQVRLERLERTPAQDPLTSQKFRWFWLVFLAGLALAWQILARLH